MVAETKASNAIKNFRIDELPIQMNPNTSLKII